MANTAYRRQQVGQYLRYFRVHSYDERYRTQTELGKVLGLSQKQVSLIENGLLEPTLQAAAGWCRITGWHEGWQLISHMYHLDPLDVVPVHPELNSSLASTILNLEKQLREAQEALEELKRIWQARRPGRELEVSRYLLEHKKQIFDLIPAVESLLIAAEREAGVPLEEVARVWNQHVLDEGIAMPRLEELEPALAVGGVR